MSKKFNIKRATKFNIITSGNETFTDFLKQHADWVNSLNAFFWDLISSDKIDIKKSNLQYIFVNHLNDKLTHCEIKNQNLFGLKDLLKEVGLDKCQIKYIRGIIQYIIDRYKSFYKRNRREITSGSRKLNYISIKGKEVQLKNQMIILDREKNALYLDIFLKNHSDNICINYDPQKSFLNHIDGLGSSKVNKFGGNYIVKQGILVACNDIDKTFSYDPKHYLGIDINKNSESWICLSSSILGVQKFKKPDIISSLEKQIESINKKLHSRFRGANNKILKTGERPFNSKVARKLRLKIQKLHKKQKKEIERFLSEIGIIDHVVSNKLLLCMDMVACGQTQGTFGQDKITKYLIKECENRSIPFCKPPTNNTSRTCTKCNHCDPKNRTQQSIFKCRHCGHTENADIQAAKNTGRFGWAIFHKFDSSASENDQISYITKNFIKSKKVLTKPVIGKRALAKKPASQSYLTI